MEKALTVLVKAASAKSKKYLVMAVDANCAFNCLQLISGLIKDNWEGCFLISCVSQGAAIIRAWYRHPCAVSFTAGERRDDDEGST